jgi:hypothetical protein
LDSPVVVVRIDLDLHLIELGAEGIDEIGLRLVALTMTASIGTARRGQDPVLARTAFQVPELLLQLVVLGITSRVMITPVDPRWL